MLAPQYTVQRAVILLSGGLDSAVTLAHAQAAGHECYALSIDYGQRHRAELTAARAIAQRCGVTHREIKLDLRAFGGSALTSDDIAVPTAASEGVPVTYVPARNTIFLSLALAWAEVLQARSIFIGANIVDYSGYPDCRPEYLAAFQDLADLATKTALEGERVVVQAPLIRMSKAEIIQRGIALGVDLSATVSCYQADAQARACGQCDACRIRQSGFKDAGVSDLTRYRN